MKMVIAGLVNTFIVFSLAPLFDGIMRKITAGIQSRKGPPISQSYYDLFKLLIKEDIDAGISPILQRLSAIFAFASVFAIGLMVPMGYAVPLTNHADAILLVYLLTLLGISTLFAGLAAGSTYSLIGMNREMMSMITLEPILAIAVIVSAVHAGSFRFDKVFSGAIYTSSLPVPVSGLMMLVVVLLALQAFIGRIPFDTTEAESEIMEGPMVEYSGPKLALFKWTRMMKVFIYCGITIAIFLPWLKTGFWPVDGLIYILLVLLLTVVVTLISAANARYRIDQAVRYYIILFGAAVAALICSALGW